MKSKFISSINKVISPIRNTYFIVIVLIEPSVSYISTGPINGILFIKLNHTFCQLHIPQKLPTNCSLLISTRIFKSLNWNIIQIRIFSYQSMVVQLGILEAILFMCLEEFMPIRKILQRSPVPTLAYQSFKWIMRNFMLGICQKRILRGKSSDRKSTTSLNNCLEESSC